MYFNDITIGVVKEYLVPAGQCPFTIVGIGNIQLLQFLFEAFNIVCTETEMAIFNRINPLLHPESGFVILLCNVKLHLSICQKFYLSIIAVRRFRTGKTMLFILDTV